MGPHAILEYASKLVFQLFPLLLPIFLNLPRNQRFPEKRAEKKALCDYFIT